MSDDRDYAEELRSALLGYASELRSRSENLASDQWSKSFENMPTLRQQQYGMSLEAECTADEIVRMCGMDPRSLWPDKVKRPPLPDEERSQLVWAKGTPA